MRCLDAMFLQDGERRKMAATKELFNLQPSGRSPEALDRFFTRYRHLMQQATHQSVGRYAQAEVLQRAADANPRLALACAAWKQMDGANPNSLLARMEESVDEALRGGGARRPEAAWLAADQGSSWSWAAEPGARAVEEVDRREHAMAANATDGRNARAQQGKGSADPVCWRCGKPGHRRHECRETIQQGGGQDAVLSKMGELITLLRTTKLGENAPISKKA